MLVTATAYVATVVAVLLGLPSRATAELASRLRRHANHSIVPVLSGLAVWSAIALAWNLLEGGTIPLPVAAAAFLWIGWSAQRHGVPMGGVLIAGAEQAGILVSTIVAAVLVGEARWY